MMFLLAVLFDGLVFDFAQPTRPPNCFRLRLAAELGVVFKLRVTQLIGGTIGSSRGAYLGYPHALPYRR